MQSSGPVAQGIEHRIPNPGVAGSNPAGITKTAFYFAAPPRRELGTG